jgi:exonuclease 3'-5' domain-containing protein 1
MPRKVETEILDTPEAVAQLVDRLVRIHTLERGEFHYSPTMYIDLEGVNLCREGSISIFTLMVDLDLPIQHVYLIDVHVLGAQAFTTASTKGTTTLKDILQDKTITKVFFDVRNDSDALFAHYGVALQGVEDVQLMESATRETTGSRKYLTGLAKCIDKNMLMWFGNMRQDPIDWKQSKETGERLFKAEHGGSYEVFNERPIPDAIVRYCVGDVRCLPEVYKNLRGVRACHWRDLVRDATKTRIASTHAPDYQPHGRERTLAPWTDEQNKTLDEMNYKPPAREYFDDVDEYGYDDYDEYGYDDYYDIRDDNDFEDWTRMPWQGPPS